MARKPSTSSATAPAHNDIKKSLLALVRRKGEASLVEAVAHVGRKFKMSAKARAERLSCGKETKLQNAVRWARWELQREGKVKTTRRGYFAAL